MAFEKELEELKQRKEKALQMGGPEKVKKQHESGRLTARERINELLDQDSFFEIGMLNHSDVPGMEDKTPADSKVAGFGHVDRRKVAIIANDFTVMAASSSRIAGKKEMTLDKYATSRGFPVIYLGQAGGARMPDIMGARGLCTMGLEMNSFARGRRTPMMAAVMGDCFGMPTWMAMLADFVVMVKGSCMAVSGPRVLELAISEKVDEEELGGWRVHEQITGMADIVVNTERECFEAIRKFLSYMPSHIMELPPVKPVPPGSGADMPKILDYLPESRRQTYDMRKIIRMIVDGGGIFQLKERYGRSVITALARINGQAVGFIANQPMFMSGAMDTDGCDKVTSFMCLCDSFNIPLIFLHDIPGFLIGSEAEHKKVAAKIINYMNALAQVTVPKISIIVRKTYGQAFFNMCGTGCGADFLVAWPSADISFMDPETGVNVVFGAKLKGKENVEEERKKFLELWGYECSPYPAAGHHLIHDVIDPRETRDFIIRCLDLARNETSNGLSEHRLANWPTKF